MEIRFADWILDVNLHLTMEISAQQAQDHCQCGYCRNFYAAVDHACPNLRTFLASFGIDVEGPDELCPFEPTIYEVTYVVQGQILEKGRTLLNLDGVPIVIRDAEEADLETSHPMPYFTVTVGLIELPWLLAENMDDVISPANEPEYLQRMERKLLERMSNSDIFS